MIKKLKISHMAHWFANEPVWETSSMQLSIPEFQCIKETNKLRKQTNFIYTLTEVQT